MAAGRCRAIRSVRCGCGGYRSNRPGVDSCLCGSLQSRVESATRLQKHRSTQPCPDPRSIQMSGTIATSWSASDFCLASTPHGSEEEFAHLATAIYDRVCRTDFRAPGFCLVNLGADLSSQSFRRFMVALD